MNRPSVLLVVVVLGMVLDGAGLLYFDIRTGRIEAAVLPRRAWGFGVSNTFTFYTPHSLTPSSPGGEEERTVYDLGLFRISVRTR